ncbi:unnamed protein product [Calypogeia fissa]
MLTADQLKQLVKDDLIDTVIVGLTDCYGRTVGKRCTANFFLESVISDGTHACSYILATDSPRPPICNLGEGVKATYI